MTPNPAVLLTAFTTSPGQSPALQASAGRERPFLIPRSSPGWAAKVPCFSELGAELTLAVECHWQRDVVAIRCFLCSDFSFSELAVVQRDVNVILCPSTSLWPEPSRENWRHSDSVLPGNHFN